MRNSNETVGNIIDKSNITILGSVDEEGFPNEKAMLPPRLREGIKHIFLSTNTSSLRVEQFQRNSKACLYFFDKRFFRGVMLKGTITVLEDSQIKESLWRDGDTLYYPLGVTDPDYCVLKFTAISGRYYSNFKSENFDIK